MKKIMLIIICLFFTTCTHNRWTTQDKVLEAAWQVAHIIDYGTTLDLADQPSRHEHNIFLGEKPSRGEVHAFFIANAIIHPIIVTFLPKRCKIFGFNVPMRALYQSIELTTAAGCAVNNLHIGLRMAF